MSEETQNQADTTLGDDTTPKKSRTTPNRAAAKKWLKRDRDQNVSSEGDEDRPNLRSSALYDTIIEREGGLMSDGPPSAREKFKAAADRVTDAAQVAADALSDWIKEEQKLRTPDVESLNAAIQAARKRGIKLDIKGDRVTKLLWREGKSDPYLMVEGTYRPFHKQLVTVSPPLEADLG